MEDTKEMKDRIFELAEVLIAADSQLRIANNEEDQTTEAQLDAAHFITLNGDRIGRDLELYAFMSEIEGVPSLTVRILKELVSPLKRVAPKAFEAGITCLRSFDVFGEKQKEWSTLLDSFVVKKEKKGGQ